MEIHFRLNLTKYQLFEQSSTSSHASSTLITHLVITFLQFTRPQGLAKLDNIVREHVNHNVGGMFVDFSCCR